MIRLELPILQLGLLSTIPLEDTLEKVKQEQSEHESACSRISMSVQSSLGEELVVRRDSDSSSSSSEGNVPSRAAFPFDSTGHGREAKHDGLGYHKEEERIKHYIGHQESGFSTDSDIAARPTFPFASESKKKDADVEPKWTVRDHSGDGRPEQYEDSSSGSVDDNTATASSTDAYISLPLIADKTRKGPPTKKSNPDIPYGTTDGPKHPHHHRTTTPLEQYKAFETRVESEFEEQPWY